MSQPAAVTEGSDPSPSPSPSAVTLEVAPPAEDAASAPPGVGGVEADLEPAADAEKQSLRERLKERLPTGEGFRQW
jgi:hypothetical protein